MNNKKNLGQFYTTNYKYILQRFDKPKNIKTIEPFCGNGDLLNWINIDEIYDKDPKIQCIKKDTLLNPPDYRNKFIITNPPFLSKNKTNLYENLFIKYKTNDLYKVFIKTIVDGDIDSGILILPSNFLCSMDWKIRDYFFSKYYIEKLNIFEETVFNDTDIPICSFSFKKGKQREIDLMFFPNKKNIFVRLEKNNKWLIGGDIYKPVKSKYKFGRLLKGQKSTTNIFLNATDTGSIDKKIKLSIQKPFYGKQTDRNFATITSNILIKNEQKLVDNFNEYFNQLRDKYNSMFLTNFRNSTVYTRKRISFYLTYNILKKLLDK